MAPLNSMGWLRRAYQTDWSVEQLVRKWAHSGLAADTAKLALLTPSRH